MNKKKAEILNLQFDLGKSLVQGNTNQIGWKAWSGKLDQIANDVFDYVNHSFSLMKNVENLKAKIVQGHAKKSNTPEPLRSLERQYHKTLDKLNGTLLKTVEVKDFPPVDCARFFNFTMHYNTFRIHYNYLSTDMEEIQLSHIHLGAFLYMIQFLGVTVQISSKQYFAVPTISF